MVQTPDSQLKVDSTAAKAAAGFYTKEVTPSKDADFEFLFTRAI